MAVSKTQKVVCQVSNSGHTFTIITLIKVLCKLWVKMSPEIWSRQPKSSYQKLNIYATVKIIGFYDQNWTCIFSSSHPNLIKMNQEGAACSTEIYRKKSLLSQINLYSVLVKNYFLGERSETLWGTAPNFGKATPGNLSDRGAFCTKNLAMSYLTLSKPFRCQKLFAAKKIKEVSKMPHFQRKFYFSFQ